VSLVLDGSAVLAWCFEDEAYPAIDAVMLCLAAEGAVLPNLWRLAVANELHSAMPRRRLSSGMREEFLAALTEMDITTDHDTDR
jgi:hypothetical protein